MVLPRNIVSPSHLLRFLGVLLESIGPFSLQIENSRKVLGPLNHCLQLYYLHDYKIIEVFQIWTQHFDPAYTFWWGGGEDCDTAYQLLTTLLMLFHTNSHLQTLFRTSKRPRWSRGVSGFIGVKSLHTLTRHFNNDTGEQHSHNAYCSGIWQKYHPHTHTMTAPAWTVAKVTTNSWSQILTLWPHYLYVGLKNLPQGCIVCALWDAFQLTIAVQCDLLFL